MSNATDFAALKASIQSLYQKGTLVHTTDPNALENVVVTTSGAQGVGGTGAYYVSGLVEDVPYFIDPAGTFNSTTPVLPGDILRVPIDEFSMDRTVLNTLSDIKITLTEPSPITLSHAQDSGYSILRKHTHSDLDDIFSQIDKIKSDLGL